MSHKFTHEEAIAGGKKRASMPDFQKHQEAFEMLKAKRPDCWRWIYKNRVKPYMQNKQS